MEHARIDMQTSAAILLIDDSLQARAAKALAQWQETKTLKLAAWQAKVAPSASVVRRGRETKALRLFLQMARAMGFSEFRSWPEVDRKIARKKYHLLGGYCVMRTLDIVRDDYANVTAVFAEDGREVRRIRCNMNGEWATA